MKTDILQSYVLPVACGVLLGAALIASVHAEGPAQPPGAPKVRVIVKENNVATKAGGTSATTPPAGTPARPQGAGGQPPGPAQAASAADAEKYTRTTKKSLTIDLVNLTTASMDVTAKTTFLAKDETGKRDVVTEKTVENQLTLQPAKAGQFTTEEVGFTHTAAHRAAAQKPGGGGGGKAPVAPMLPASGHAYFGYKVEVFQGSDLVGTAVSDNH